MYNNKGVVGNKAHSPCSPTPKQTTYTFVYNLTNNLKLNNIMTSEDIAKKIESVIEKLDEWAVSVYDMPDGGKSLQIDLDYTPCGQDFSFEIEVEKEETLESVIKKIEDYVENYDPDYEASQWIQDGHGINGAPYHIKDILDDMEYVQGELKELSKVIRADV